MKLGIHKQALKEIENLGLWHCIENNAGIQRLLRQEENSSKIPQKATIPPLQIPPYHSLRVIFDIKNVTASTESTKIHILET